MRIGTAHDLPRNQILQDILCSRHSSFPLKFNTVSKSSLNFLSDIMHQLSRNVHERGETQRLMLNMFTYDAPLHETE